MVDSGHVEPGCVHAEHRDVRLPGAGGGQQVVDVHAALEHDDPAPLAEQPQRRGLPGRTGGDDQDDDHVSPA